MAKWGKMDYKAFEKMAKNFEEAVKKDIGEQLIIAILQEAGNKLLRKVKSRTPVKSGVLHDRWYISSVKRSGNNLYIEIYNNVEYASFVEYGHRQDVGRYVPAIGKRLKNEWVEGKFMLTISMKEIEALLPKIADKHCKRVLEQLFN